MMLMKTMDARKKAEVRDSQLDHFSVKLLQQAYGYCLLSTFPASTHLLNYMECE